MDLPGHTLGPTCAYHEEEPDKPLPEGSDAPRVRAQFFYVSSLPIDDPLSPVPPISADKSVKHPPQPFSVRDDAALEEAWLGFQNGQDGKHNGRPKSSSRSRGIFSFPKFKDAILESNVQQYNKLPKKPESTSSNTEGKLAEETTKPTELATHAIELTNAFGMAGQSKDFAGAPVQATAGDTGKESHVMLSQTPQDSGKHAETFSKEELSRDSTQSVQLPDKTKRKRHFSPFHRHSQTNENAEGSSPRTSTPQIVDPSEPPAQASTSDMSGRPFARAPSKRDIKSRQLDGIDDESVFSEASDNDVNRRGRSQGKKAGQEMEKPKVFVPVGVSRLHLVEMPDLMMKPIYWSPINDTSKVIRATWFYKDTMLPVPTEVANQLEAGYEDISPYAESYQDELQACIDHGATAELKVVHKLWPDQPTPSRPGTSASSKLEELTDSQGFTAKLPSKQENAAVEPEQAVGKRMFETYSVIYVDRKNAQILRPNLLPSVRYNRRPLSAVRKGRQIGIAVVRGFDRKAYDRLHKSPKMDARAAHAKVGAYMSQSGDATTRDRRKSCTTCNDDRQAPNVSDLILVIHGIGQKLSERVDSFHFTHAINDVRRQFNVELSSEAVKGNLKQNAGMMVLPVNWRLTVSFDDEAKSKTADDEQHKYHLQDITPDTLPAVRSIISDVMLDIPYYMSHHKDKMTSAVIREANRVYRLWCRNNPGFHEHGRVHIVAHSLGSVMAMEILSQQPTKVPGNLRLNDGKPSEKMFEFGTTNLFCCGSPCGFFLLLNNARLVPRKGRDKPGMESEDCATGITGEEAYGCLAVDNIYNILHQTDPISYLVNAAVDPDYAESLQPANIPPATASFWSRMWKAGIADAYIAKGPPSRPQMQSMPSTVEMDTHNFTREEIAEKRMYLLNENGQIDYFLPSTGGPLEIQYLSMLSAHSSYWISQDFIRFLVTEIGRKSGKANTLHVLRALKKREWKRGTLV